MIRFGSVFLIALHLTSSAIIAEQCPFCAATEPSFSTLAANADIVLLGASVDGRLSINRVYKGSRLLEGRGSVTPSTTAPKGSLALACGTASQTGIRWNTVVVDEFTLGYFVAAMNHSAEPAKSLPFFARYLEHPDELLANDAYLEFAQAPFSSVARVAGLLSSEQLRAWLASPTCPDSRKGLYGLLLGLRKMPEKDRAFMERLIFESENDFRTGLDGIMGGYLFLSGPSALAKLEEKILSNPEASEAKVRHLVRALRVYWQYGGEIPKERLRKAMRHQLGRPAAASEAIVDLARWEDWDALDRILQLEPQARTNPRLQRTIIGFLIRCPTNKAREQLSRYEAEFPERVREARKMLPILGGIR